MKRENFDDILNEYDDAINSIQFNSNFIYVYISNRIKAVIRTLEIFFALVFTSFLNKKSTKLSI